MFVWQLVCACGRVASFEIFHRHWHSDAPERSSMRSSLNWFGLMLCRMAGYIRPRILALYRSGVLRTGSTCIVKVAAVVGAKPALGSIDRVTSWRVPLAARFVACKPSFGPFAKYSHCQCSLVPTRQREQE